MSEAIDKSFTAKISAQNFLKAISSIYGPIENLKFDWVCGVMLDWDGKWDAQLVGIKKIAKSETDIEYEVDLWAFVDREPEIEEYKKIEAQIRIADDMLKYSNENLPLSSISVKESELTGQNGIPPLTSYVWLHYGDL